MFCSRCGADVAADAAWCPRCGLAASPAEPNPPVSQARPESTRACPSCGSPMAPQAAWCPKCGLAAACGEASGSIPTPASSWSSQPGDWRSTGSAAGDRRSVEKAAKAAAKAAVEAGKEEAERSKLRKRYSDRSRLSSDANKALDRELVQGEAVEVIIPGARGSAIIGSACRGFVWKQGRLGVYPYENLSSVAFGDGLKLKWVQFRGPSIGLVEPGLTNIVRMAEAIQVSFAPEKAASSRLTELVAAGARSILLAAPAVDSAPGRTAHQGLASMNAPIGERVLRAERVTGGMTGPVAWLTLTTDRLIFSSKEDLQPTGIKWATPLECVESVRAKKAFRAGTEVLEVFYKGAKGERDHKAFERTSVAAWANVFSGTHRSEPNSFQNFEAQILAAREARYSRPPETPAASPGSQDLATQLTKLVEIHVAGGLTDAEFTAAKARILGG